MLVKTMAKVPTTASKIKFSADKIPIAATHHIVAAVFNPLILLSLIIIEPAQVILFQILLGLEFS